ncbi:hypothetical protein C8Q79DRAFT_927757 [Trametes meyenii]|nr:hypothetical protein C8Q79DRAFT_927757 [Trametes meyenii]
MEHSPIYPAYASQRVDHYNSGDGNIPAIRLQDADPMSLSQWAIKQRLETLERQRAHYLHQYARSTCRAPEISNGLNECFDSKDDQFDRDETIMTLHCAQERLVAARFDGAYLDIVSRDVAHLHAALRNGATGQSADEEEEEEVATEITHALCGRQ